jgi:hypothetical protein
MKPILILSRKNRQFPWVKFPPLEFRIMFYDRSPIKKVQTLFRVERHVRSGVWVIWQGVVAGFLWEASLLVVIARPNQQQSRR